MTQDIFLPLPASIKVCQIKFLTLTAPISEPFVPLLLENLKVKLQSHDIVEDVIEEDVVGEALTSEKTSLISTVDQLVPRSLHVRADSS